MSNHVQSSWITTIHWKPTTMSAWPLFVSVPVRTPSCVIVRVPDQEALLARWAVAVSVAESAAGHQIIVERVRRDRRIEQVEALSKSRSAV